MGRIKAEAKRVNTLKEEEQNMYVQLQRGRLAQVTEQLDEQLHKRDSIDKFKFAQKVVNQRLSATNPGLGQQQKLYALKKELEQKMAEKSGELQISEIEKLLQDRAYEIDFDAY